MKNQALSASQVRMSSGEDATRTWTTEISKSEESGLLQVAGDREKQVSQGSH